jgi:hypothetical protein
MPFIAHTPEPPYYAVIFTSINAEVDHDEHTQTYRRLLEVAAGYPGFLGIEPARNVDGSGIAAIYGRTSSQLPRFRAILSMWWRRIKGAKFGIPTT